MKDQASVEKKNEFRYILFLGLLAAVPPLATDMYLAAMPTIARHFSVTESQVGQSLVLWFLSFSIFLLICGPVADKIGRKPVLFTGLSIFCISTILCGLSQNLWQLILFRILQGVGASAPSSMCMAICRDKYEGKRRKDILAYIAIILCIAPMVAPTIGAALMKFFSWRFIFFMQSFLAIVMIVVSIPYKETLANPLQTSWPATFGRYTVLFRNKGYMVSNGVMGMIPGPFYGYLALSPIVYISIFKLSEFAFGLFFAYNALIAIAGSYSCTRLTKIYTDRTLITLCLAGCIIGGVGMTIFGASNYWLFALFISIITYFSGMSRPMSNHFILEQVDSDIGSASSFIVFYQMFFGQLCMMYSTHQWSRPIFLYGIMAIVIPVVVMVIWLVFVRQLEKEAHKTEAIND